jgi:hypothetical protein
LAALIVDADQPASTATLRSRRKTACLAAAAHLAAALSPAAALQTPVAAATVCSRVLMRVRVTAWAPPAPPRAHSAIRATTAGSNPRDALTTAGLEAEGAAAPPGTASGEPPPAGEAVRGADAGAPVAPADAAASAAGFDELLFRLTRRAFPLLAA